MLRHTLNVVVALLVFGSFGAAEAQLFKRGAERREQRQSRPGLFQRNKEQTGTTGKTSRPGLLRRNKPQKSGDSKLGLFKRAKERKLQQDTYSNASSASYVPRTQKISTSSPILQQSAARPTVPTQGLSTRPVSSEQAEAQLPSSQLPSLVTEVAAPPKPTRRPSLDDRERRETQSVPIATSPIRDATSENPVAQPTGNLPDLSEPAAEAIQSVLA